MIPFDQILFIICLPNLLLNCETEQFKINQIWPNVGQIYRKTSLILGFSQDPN